MKVKLFIFLISYFVFNAMASAYACPAMSTKQSDKSFVVETDSQSATESLNRISGTIDTGYSSPDKTYQSPDHYRAGPFGRQQAMDKHPENK